jgi:hypothetical protein
VALLSLPLALLGSGAATVASAAVRTPHGLTAPAQVAATNWSAMSNPITTPVADTEFSSRVSCVTSDFCMSVGPIALEGEGAGFAQTWNGSTWSAPLTLPSIPSATATDLSSVSCVTTSFCIAVGVVTSGTSTTTESPLIEQWNGMSWVAVVDSLSVDGIMLAVSCPSVSSCVAVGISDIETTGSAIAEQWNGSTWTSTSIPEPSAGAIPFDISCTTLGTCMTVGVSNVGSTPAGWSDYLNASGWTSESVPDGSYVGVELLGVSCAGASFCMTTGIGTTDAESDTGVNVAEVWNGSGWTLDTSIPNPSTSGENVLFGVNCFSATSCTAVGGSGTSLDTTDGVSTEVMNWNGSGWTQATSPNPPNGNGSILTGISCLTDWACVAVGFSNNSSESSVPFDITAPIARSGYRFVASDGGIFNYGPSSGLGAPFLGSMGGQPLNAPMVGMADMPAGDGYYEVASDGGVFNYGSAQFYGSTGSIHLNAPIVGMAVTPDGGGYWLVASDGGVFNYGDAQFYGSMGGQPLNKPIVGIASTPNGNGYYLVASDGGIFSFPNNPNGPPFLGSTGGTPLNKPIVGMAETSAGQYYLVASDGGVFSFPEGPSGPPFYGSTGSIKLNKPVIGMALTAGGAGYYLGAADGGIFSYPEGATGPPFYGSRGGQPLNKPIVGIAG